MSSLTNTASFARKFMIVCGILISSSILILIVYSVGSGAYKSFFPEGPPPPIIAFGKLPEISLSEGFAPPKNVTYRIETVSGNLEELPMEVKVFAIEDLEVKFGDMPRTNSWAEALGFNVPAFALNNNRATFSEKEDTGRTLTLGLTSQIGEIKSNYATNLDLISSSHKGEVGAKSVADKVVAVFGLKEKTYPADKIEYVKYKIDNGGLTRANELATTNLIQVSYNRSDIDKIPVDYPVFGESKVWVLTSNSLAVSASVNVSAIEEYKFSTYPLEGVVKAFEDLKAGKASYNKRFDGQTFDILNVRLGYLDTTSKQAFLQPVYVFVGNDGLKAYVGAVSDSLVEPQK